jgi:phosphatidylserine decarboxylase
MGDEVKSGERFGMIKYGSRVDVFLPLSTKINVRINERVKAGETIIGEL